MDDGSRRSKAVLVIGAGISGMQSTLLLAELGYKVYLLDSAPAIGGSMHLLDRTFPTDSCGLCLMLPGRAAYCPTIECDIHPNVEIIPYAEVVDLQGEAGDFTVTVRHKPRYVDVDLCNNCGLCAEVCPQERPDSVSGYNVSGFKFDESETLNLRPETGLTAIYRPPTRAIPPAYVIDMDDCTRCGKCVQVCPTHAIDLGMEERRSEVKVGAVIVSPGFEPFDARLKGEYGFGHYDNVLTSIQFERMISISGPTGAAIVRPSHGETPKRIAFIQCVGSRDEAIGRGYCSSVCCMYTAKQVQVAKKLQPDLDVTVFFIDIRAQGKDFDEYFDQVEGLPGVTYRRAMVSSVHQHQQTRDLKLNYVAEDGSLEEEDFDMVVLAVGLGPPQGSQQLGQALGVELNRYGFGVTHPFTPGESSRPGILVSGAFREPKDIPETVVEASAAAARAACLLRRPSYDPLPAAEEEEVEERDVSYEWPRVGVFLCDCRGEIGSVVDLQSVADHIQGLRDVELAQTLDNACLASGRKQIGQAIETHQLNRVVVAGCAPRLYKSGFERMMREARLNPGLMERVNLRGECAWVHQGNGRVATAKATQLVEMAVASVRLKQAVQPVVEEASQRALVVGGGLAGMTAALNLAEMGHEVDLVERSAELGGELRELRYTLEGDDPALFLSSLVDRVECEGDVHVYREAQVEEVSGYVGRYQTTVALSDGSKQTLRHGGIIVATGGHEAMPTEYLYGEDPRVVTQRDLEKTLAGGEDVPSDVVMIQCVGSREPERPYCSRVCCSKAVANALKVKERDSEAHVFVLYREMRTYGFREDYYREARSQGVVFLRYELPHKPEVSAGKGGLTVRLREPITDQEVVIRAGMLVLSTGIEANDNRALADLLGVPLDENGFFQEEYAKMRPLDFSRRGVFMCGLAHSPCFADEAIAQAQAAALRAASLLAQPKLEALPVVASVSPKRCSACGLCVEVCPYEARVLEPGWPYAEVVDVLCEGCGVCVVACPNKASELKGLEVAQVYGKLDAVTMTSGR